MIKKRYRELKKTLLIVAWLASISLLVILPQSVKADDLPVIHVSGYLSTDTTWQANTVYMIDGGLTVGSGVTLTIEPGTIVKSGGGPNSEAIFVYLGGTVHANGTMADPIIFTSYKDDAAGGDSNGDGYSVGANGDYGTALRIYNNVGGAVDIRYATFRYGVRSLSCSSTATSITTRDTLLQNTAEFMQCSNLSLLRNTFDTSGQAALQLTSMDVTGVVLSGIDKNTFLGNGASKALDLRYAYVPSGKLWTFSGETMAVVTVNQLEVRGGMTIQDGAIIKLANNASGMYAYLGGTIEVVSASANKVVFTSIKDDSAGGDTNNNGPSQGSFGDYHNAIRINQGSIDISNAVFRNGDAAVECFGSGQITVRNSSLKNAMNVSQCSAPVVLENNEFDITGGSRPAVNAISDVSSIALDGSNKNTFIGSGMGRVVYVYYGTIPSNKSWSISGGSGAVVVLDNNLVLNGNLSLHSGAILKHQSYSKISVASGASLTVEGSISSPVKFTSYKDDSVAGDSNGNGASAGSAGDYETSIDWGANATVSIAKATFDYGGTVLDIRGSEASLTDVALNSGSTAIRISGNAKVNASGMSISNFSRGIYALDSSRMSYRGNFSNIQNRAIESCDWGQWQPCMVDAAYVDWGTSLGPIAGDKACGSVIVSPWRYGGASFESGMTKNCYGNDTPAERLANRASYFQSEMSDAQVRCNDGFQDACTAINNAIACLGGAWSAAQSTAPWPLPPTSTAEEINAAGGLVLSGASTYLTSQSTVSVAGFSFSLLTEALSVAGTMVTLANAYESCAP